MTTAEEAERLSSDEAGRDELLQRLMNERVRGVAGAGDRAARGQPASPLYLIPGNDDEFAIDEVLDRPEYAPVNADGKVLDIPGGLQLLVVRLVEPHARGRPRGRRPRTSSTRGSTRSPSRFATPAARSS